MRREQSDADTTLACPNCDRAGLSYRRYSGHGDPLSASVDADPHYQCLNCGTRVDDPVEREKHQPGYGGHAKLRRAGFGDLVDGGEST